MALAIKEVRTPVKVQTETESTDLIKIPGIAVAAAYADGDVMGVQFSIMVPESGIIQSANLYDVDDEGLQVDLVIHRAPWTTVIADNAAMDLADEDLVKVIYVIAFTSATFVDFTNGQVALVPSIGKAYKAKEGKLYVTARARGALNIAAGKEPRIQIDFLGDG